jgi:hypothetical protein
MNVTSRGDQKMISLLKIEEQLHEIGFRTHGWGKGEVKELCKILADDEVILQCVNGYYQNGFAMLLATNQRLLLVDQKPMFLTIEAVWYDKIGQIEYNHRLLNSNLCISSPSKDIKFTSMNQIRLRQILAYAQEKMIAARGPNQAYGGYGRPEYANDYPQTAIPYQNSTTTQAVTTEPPVVDALAATVQEAPKTGSIYSATSLPFTRHRYFSEDS